MAETSGFETVPQGSHDGPVTDGGARNDVRSTLPSGRSVTGRGLHALPVAVLLLGAAVTVLLALAAASANSNGDHRLLNLQVRQAAALSSAVASVQTPLTAAFDASAGCPSPR